MGTPGTAVINLPAYIAPAFNTPSVPLGGKITSITIESTSAVNQTNVPFTLGHAFKKGQLAPTDQLDGLQINVKSTHKDGSVAHAIISGVLPSLNAGEAKVIDLVRSADVVKGIAPGPKAPVVVNFVIAGIKYSAKPSGTTLWQVGPYANEVLSIQTPIVDEAGNAHPDITLQFQVTAYAGTANERVSITVEHTKAYTATKDVIYDISMEINGVVRFTNIGRIHFPCARFRKVFWSDAEPQIHIKHNTSYLIESKAVPNWEQIKISETTLAQYQKDLNTLSFGPMAYGRFQPGMEAPGGRPDIGLAPDCYASAVLSMDKRAKDLMLASGEVAGSWSVHRRDPDGKMFDIIHWPRASILGNIGDTINPLTKLPEKLPALTTTSKLSSDSAHQPAFAYIPYLLAGDYFYLEELQFWLNFNSYVSNPYYRSYEKGFLKSNQVRGQGWSLRTLAEGLFVTPDDHPLKPALNYWMGTNMEYYRVTYTDNTAGTNPLHIITDGNPIAYTVKGIVSTGMAPWMDDFAAQGIGRCAELGNEEAARLLKWKVKFQVGRMIDPEYCFTNACIYALRVRETATSPMYPTLGECLTKTLEADYAGLVCNSPERLVVANKYKPNSNVVQAGEITGWAMSPEGYPSNFQPALAMAVDVGYEGAKQAWDKFISRSVKPDYSTSPQFNVVPRVEAVVIPPVVVEPPPVVVEPPPVVVTPPEVVVEPPVVVAPPVVVPPEVIPDPVVTPPEVVVVVPEIPDPKVVISNNCLSSMEGLTVLLVSGPVTKVAVNQVANAAGEIVITDKTFAKGVRYECTVLSKEGYKVAIIFPIQVI